jgi:hypothetical protein
MERLGVRHADRALKCGGKVQRSAPETVIYSSCLLLVGCRSVAATRLIGAVFRVGCRPCGKIV